ncbi:MULTISPECIES: hypothetical protein [unclassified Kribbella]|uniref:hypothetical protein n=1 Tax=unclassified Kribbella TaxID=2644121 RepID=UPI0033C1A842
MGNGLTSGTVIAGLPMDRGMSRMAEGSEHRSRLAIGNRRATSLAANASTGLAVAVQAAGVGPGLQTHALQP